MANGNRNDPYKDCNFLVEIDGVASGGFAECSGIAAETQVVDYREGNEDQPRVRKEPGLTKYASLVLKRGYTQDRALWQWYQTILDGNVQRKQLSVVLLDAERNPVLRWNFHGAWISKYEGPRLHACGNDIAIETVEIAHEGFVLAE